MDLAFLKRLKQKLQIGNTRSIHLNSYPGRLATRLDISDFNYINSTLANTFLNGLITNPKFRLSFKIELNDVLPGIDDEKINEKKKKLGLISKRLTSILYENEDNFLEHGIKTFGFGYPTLVYRSKNDPEKIICAPVYIWKMDLARNKNEWIFSRDEDHPITLNEVLLNFLEQDLNTSGFVKITEDYLTDSLLDKSEILAISNTLLKQINENSSEITELQEITGLPDKEKRVLLLRNEGNPVLISAGSLGLYRSQKEAVIKDIKNLIANINEFSFDKLKSETYQTIPYSSIDTDPTQENVLKSLKNNSRLIIHGPPGTGKSQSLTAIIVNALANKAKCLVVCEKRTALEVIKKNLEQTGLGSLCGIIEDVNRDRKQVINSVRSREREENSIDINIYNRLISEADSYIEKINKGHLFYDRKMINENNWTNLVGRYLEMKKAEQNYEKLFLELKNCGIDFTGKNISEEYNTRFDGIKQNFSLYHRTEGKAGIFRILNDKLFTGTAAKEIQIALKEYLDKILILLNEAIISGDNIISGYKTNLDVHYREYFKTLNLLIAELISIYSSDCNSNLYQKLTGVSPFLLNFISVFSSNYKKIKQNKLRSIEIYNNINDLLKAEYFQFKRIELDKTLAIIPEYINSLVEVLNKWFEEIPVLVENESKLLSTEHFNRASINGTNEIEKFLLNCCKITAELDSSEFFNLTFTSESGTVFSHKDTLKKANEYIKGILVEYSNLYDYSIWRNNYIHQDDINKSLVDCLIKINSDDWENDFKSWFIFNTLISNEQKISLNNNDNHITLEDNLMKIKKFQVDIIKSNWQSVQHEAKKEFEKKHGISINALYNKSRNNHFTKINSLRRIINADYSLFTGFFPVLLVNPVVCSSLFEMKEGLFDIVIFDEASQLKIEDVYAAKLRGKNRVVSGDENQMPPSSYFSSVNLVVDGNENAEEDDFNPEAAVAGIADSESLLDYAIRSGYRETNLEIHYRSKHPDLIEFSNAAFYDSRLKPFPPADDNKPIEYYQVNGIYDQEESINRDEAAKVIELIDGFIILNGETADKSIGIATLNIFQRNYILDMVKEKSDRNPLFARKIEALRSISGEEFFVKNLENIQGDERDIIIISTTFGKREDGKFTQTYGPINQAKGYRLLNVIITRAKKKLVVCTSIPEEVISTYKDLHVDAVNKGKGVLYAYLAYAKAVHEGNSDEKNAILHALSQNVNLNYAVHSGATESVFEQEVVDLLCGHIPAERIEVQFPLGGFRIDIAVRSKQTGRPIIAIECDGAKYHSSPEAYAWDIFRQKLLENHGFKFIRIWSANWWNNPEKELQRVLEQIYDSDKSDQ